MTSPFDQKNKLARTLDHLALRALLLFLSVGYFFLLWRSLNVSLLCGGALFALLCLSIMLVERRTLSRREMLLRERVGGMIALDELILLPSAAASRRVRDLLSEALDAQRQEGCLMRYGEELWLVRLAQCLPGSSCSEGDVLAAHRARIESGADKCALAATGSFSPAASRAAEWVDPPVRLIAGRQLSLLFGRAHPATDEEIARHMASQKKPFSFARIRALALSPAKLKRYLLCALLLCLFYLITGSLSALSASLLSFALAVACRQNSRRCFTL